MLICLLQPVAEDLVVLEDFFFDREDNFLDLESLLFLGDFLNQQFFGRFFLKLAHRGDGFVERGEFLVAYINQKILLHVCFLKGGNLVQKQAELKLDAFDHKKPILCDFFIGELREIETLDTLKHVNEPKQGRFETVRKLPVVCPALPAINYLEIVHRIDKL